MDFWVPDYSRPFYGKEKTNQTMRKKYISSPILTLKVLNIASPSLDCPQNQRLICDLVIWTKTTISRVVETGP